MTVLNRHPAPDHTKGALVKLVLQLVFHRPSHTNYYSAAAFAPCATSPQASDDVFPVTALLLSTHCAAPHRFQRGLGAMLQCYVGDGYRRGAARHYADGSGSGAHCRGMCFVITIVRFCGLEVLIRFRTRGRWPWCTGSDVRSAEGKRQTELGAV